MPSVYIDDNHIPVHDITGMRPDFARVVSATTTGSIQSLSISSIISADQAVNGRTMLRVLVTGTSNASFAMGVAGSPPSATTSMVTLLGNSVQYFTARAQDTAVFYQLSGTAAIEVAGMNS